MLQINGANAPSPSEMKVRIFDVGSSEERSASGGLVVDRTAVKRELTLRWAALSQDELAGLLSAVGGQVFFTAAYPDPQTGTLRSMTCRCAERTAGVLRMNGDVPIWTGVEMKWTER